MVAELELNELKTEFEFELGAELRLELDFELLRLLDFIDDTAFDEEILEELLVI